MSLPQLIDSHCHLNYDYAPKSEADLVREAMEAGITHLVTVGTEIATLPQLAAIADRHPNVFFTAGVHPHEGVTFEPGHVDVLREAAAHPKCRAIGEIGLDYYYEHSKPEEQKRALQLQLDLALELGLPIVVHARDAEADLLPMLTDYARKVPAGRAVGAIHCFTGTMAFGKSCLDLGFLISFSGILTFKTAEDLRACAREFPLEKLMVETDSPYLAPVPFRGKKCEPSMVRMTAQKVAEIKGVPIEEVARVTSENARRLFRI